MSESNVTESLQVKIWKSSLHSQPMGPKLYNGQHILQLKKTVIYTHFSVLNFHLTNSCS